MSDIVWAMNRPGRDPDETETDNYVIGYMDRTDWAYEIGAASGGNRVYPSVEDLKRDSPCTTNCGIVEVEVRFRRIIEKGSDHE